MMKAIVQKRAPSHSLTITRETHEVPERARVRPACLVFDQFLKKPLGRTLAQRSEPVFVNVYRAQESIPRNRFRQPMQPDGPVRKIGL
jgi:hypothetical protein